MGERRWNWEQVGGRTCASGRWAEAVAASVSHSRRESAAQSWIEHLARNTVDQGLEGAGFSRAAELYAYGRAVGLAVAAQHQTRFEPYLLDALRGVGLDKPAALAV
ncbi:hypothetical protein [Streptomyces sp. NPDC002640]